MTECKRPSDSRHGADGSPECRTRREFVRDAAFGAAALAAAPALTPGAEGGVPDAAKVYAVHHKDLCPPDEAYRPADPTVVRLMVKEALGRMNGGKDVGEIVRSWCPAGKTPATARVKIKYNGTRGRFPSHAEVVNGVVRLMIDDGGVKPENIHVYESCPKNFGEKDRPPFFGTPFAGGKNREPGVVYSHLEAPDGTDMPNSNYREDIRVDLGEGRSKKLTMWYWDALDNDCDILLNVCSLKRHISTPRFTTTTLSMKNHYGSIRNPHRQHGPNIGEKIAAVVMGKPIREKQRLVVVDAAYAMYTRGPDRGKLKYGVNKLLVARDMVAVDYVGWGMLHALREPTDPCTEPGEIAIAARNGVGHRAPRWQDHVVDIDMAS